VTCVVVHWDRRRDGFDRCIDRRPLPLGNVE